MFAIWTHPETWISLATLAAMEIVLGVDNIVFLTILAGKLPAAQQPLARRLGLGAALGTRLVLLFAITWLMGLTADLFTRGEQGLLRARPHPGDGRPLPHRQGHLRDPRQARGRPRGARRGKGGKASFGWTILQIALLDIVFSLDSVITAVGMAQHIQVMVVAMVLAVGVMLVFAGPIGKFVEGHPTVKMLALSFLILIGVMLVAESLDQHIPRGYVYFAMAFSLAVEMLNLRLRRRAEKPVHLHHRYEHDDAGQEDREGAARVRHLTGRGDEAPWRARSTGRPTAGRSSGTASCAPGSSPGRWSGSRCSSGSSATTTSPGSAGSTPSTAPR